jgi:small subunit ribosomal protein S4
VNGKIVNVASYQVRPNEVIKIRDSKREKGLWKAFAENAPTVEVPSWISADPKNLTAKITSKPEGDELKQVFDPKLIIEFYSR